MDIVVEDVPDNEQWKLWHITSEEKYHLGTVSYTMGETILIHTVKEMEERWSSEIKHLMHNSHVLLDNYNVYTDGAIDYISWDFEE